MPSPTVLILAPVEDEHSILVQSGLQRLGVEAVIASSMARWSGRRTRIARSADQADRTQVSIGGSSIHSVWNRRHVVAAESPEDCPSEDREFAAREWAEYQRNLTFLSDQAFWVNDNEAARRADLKAHQLEVACAVGLRIPDTLFTNDPDEVRAFQKTHGKVICKTFTPYIWKGKNGQPARTTTVTRIDSPDRISDNCPAIYQSYADKAFDVRVTIIGERAFAARYFWKHPSADHPIDLRVYDPEHVVYEPFEIPSALREKLRRLMAALGLVFGAVDLGVDAEGNVTFFEINQAGQWLYIEDLVPELPLLACFCAMLAQGRADYRVDDTPIRLKDFQRGPVWEGIVARDAARRAALIAG